MVSGVGSRPFKLDFSAPSYLRSVSPLSQDDDPRSHSHSGVHSGYSASFRRNLQGSDTSNCSSSRCGGGWGQHWPDCAYIKEGPGRRRPGRRSRAFEGARSQSSRMSNIVSSFQHHYQHHERGGPTGIVSLLGHWSGSDRIGSDRIGLFRWPTWTKYPRRWLLCFFGPALGLCSVQRQFGSIPRPRVDSQRFDAGKRRALQDVLCRCPHYTRRNLLRSC